MKKKVLIIKGTKRKTDPHLHTMEEFIRGAEDAGHAVTVADLTGRRVSKCSDCDKCNNNGGKCIRKDVMRDIYPQIIDTDIIVFATPVNDYYWTTVTGRVIERMKAIEPRITDKTFYFIGEGATPEKFGARLMTEWFEAYMEYMSEKGNKTGGYVFGTGPYCSDAAVWTTAKDKAYSMGKEI